MESIVSDQPVRTAQVDLKQHFTQTSESPFSHVAHHIKENKISVCKTVMPPEMNVCTEFEELVSILCPVIIWTRFGLYIIKMKTTVTLTFDGLISKLVGIIYTQRQMCMLNFMNIGQFCV